MPDAMKTIGHTKIDILKIDIDSGEFVIIPQIFHHSDKLRQSKPWVCQLLIEIHPAVTKAWIDLLRTIAKAGFLMFSREANTRCLQCFEYGYLHESCLIEYGIAPAMIQRNFYID